MVPTSPPDAIEGATSAAAIWWPNAAQALVAVATFVVAVAAWRVATRAHGTERSGFIADMRAQWEARADDWATILLLHRGSSFYYSEAGRAERLRVDALAEEVSSGRAGEERPSPIANERAKVRRVTRFFAHAGDALLRGQWTLDEAYALFGPDVARHYETLLWLSHKRSDTDAAPVPDKWRAWIDGLVEFNFYDQQEVLYLLAYLMRAEQCRRGDTYPHFVVDLAKEMREGEMGRLETLLTRTGKNRGRRHPPRRLRVVLQQAGRPSIESGYLRDPDPIIDVTDHALFRPRFRTVGWTRRRIRRIAPK